MIFIKILENSIQVKHKILLVFDDMIADMLSNKKLNLVVIELINRCRKLKISIVSITQSDFAVPKNIWQNFTHYFIMKIPDEEELQQIAFIHSSDIGFRYFMNLYKECTAKPYSFLVINATLALDNTAWKVSVFGVILVPVFLK